MDERQRLLYDPRRERSACGIGLVADLIGSSRKITEDLLYRVRRMELGEDRRDESRGAPR